MYVLCVTVTICVWLGKCASYITALTPVLSHYTYIWLLVIFPQII